MYKHQPFVFNLTKRTKTCRPGKVRTSLKFFRFSEEKKLCVCETIDAYIARRKKWNVSDSQLLVSHINPHKAVSSSTVSRWACQLLNLVGVDTDTLTAHSTRSASTSKASKKGVSLADVLKQGHWSQASTFQKFYHKEPIDASLNFQTAVLSKKL